MVYECQLTYPAQCAGASPKMGLKPTLKLWYQHRGLELCLVAKEERGKPSVRLVAASGTNGRCGVGMNPSGLGVLEVSEAHSSNLCSLGGNQCGKGELDVVVRSQGLALLTAGGPEQSLGAEDLCIPSLRQSLAMHNQCHCALGSVLGLLR